MMCIPYPIYITTYNATSEMEFFNVQLMLFRYIMFPYSNVECSAKMSNVPIYIVNIIFLLKY